MKKFLYKAQLALFVGLLVPSLFITSCKSSKTTASKHENRVNKASSSVVEKAVKEARSYTGTKYKYGSMSRSGVDCSGLMCLSYKAAGLVIPRTSSAQSVFGKRVYIGELEKGDLVFFGARKGSKKITHVGMVTESSKTSVKFIHASTKRGVTENELLTGYYRPLYIKAVRPTEN